MAASVVLALSLWLAARYARAATPLLANEIRAVAVAGDRVVAVRGDEVWVLTTAGRVLGRLAPKSGDSAAGVRVAAPVATPRRRPSFDDVVDRLGVIDDDPESDVVQDALDDEGVGPVQRRRAPPDATADAIRGAPATVAASRDAIWIGGAGGLRRLDTGGSGSAGVPRLTGVSAGPRHPAPAALAVASDGQHLAAIADHDVLLSSDGGLSWSTLAGLATRPRAIATSTDGGWVFVVDEDGVAVVAHRQRFALFEGPAFDVAWCGDELLIAGADGVAAWRWDVGLEARGPRVPARRLLCAPSVPDVAVALGPGLSISRDGGRSWSVRADLSMLEIASVAIEPARLWIGAATGLYVAPLADPADPIVEPSPARDAAPGRAGAARAAPRADADASARISSLRASRFAAWRDLLPAVSLVVSWSSTRPGGVRQAVWLLLTFPLGRAPARPHAGAPSAGALVRRRAVDVAALARLSRSGGVDPDDESAAEARLLRELLDEETR